MEHLADELDQSLANALHHLRTLALAGLVATFRDGARVWYRLASPEVEDAWLAVRAVAAQLAPGMDRLAADHLGDRDDLATITRDELLAGLAEDREILAYCGVPSCVHADHAVRWLTINGRPARRDIEGIPEWRRAGGPVTIPPGAV